MNKKETMLEAFLRQSKIDDKAADARDKAEKQQGFENLLRAYREFHSMPDMQTTLNIHSELPKSNQSKPVLQAKPGEKGFTEINRWGHIGGKAGPDDIIEMGDLGSEDI